jgi:hypothetical protein
LQHPRSPSNPLPAGGSSEGLRSSEKIPNTKLGIAPPPLRPSASRSQQRPTNRLAWIALVVLLVLGGAVALAIALL